MRPLTPPLGRLMNGEIAHWRWRKMRDVWICDGCEREVEAGGYMWLSDSKRRARRLCANCTDVVKVETGAKKIHDHING